MCVALFAREDAAIASKVPSLGHAWKSLKSVARYCLGNDGQIENLPAGSMMVTCLLILGLLWDVQGSVLKTCTQPGLVALTFDDGINRGTAAILDALDKHKIPASFFLVGNTLESNPAVSADLLQRIIQAGHTLGTHSYDHANLLWAEPWNLDRQLTRPAELVNELIGKYPILVRPPYGDYNAKVVEAAAKHEVQLVNWNVDSNDWRHGNNSAEILSSIKSERVKWGNSTSSSNIVLLHDNFTTPATLDLVVKHYQKEGYKFVNLEDCLGQRPYSNTKSKQPPATDNAKSKPDDKRDAVKKRRRSGRSSGRRRSRKSRRSWKRGSRSSSKLAPQPGSELESKVDDKRVQSIGASSSVSQSAAGAQSVATVASSTTMAPVPSLVLPQSPVTRTKTATLRLTVTVTASAT